MEFTLLVPQVLVFIILFIKNCADCQATKCKSNQKIALRLGSRLTEPLKCCSYSDLYRADYTNLTVRWMVDSSEDRFIKYHCSQNTELDSEDDLFLKENVDSSSALVAGSGTLARQNNCTKLIEPLSLGWKLDENSDMTLKLPEPVQVSDSGVYECFTRIDKQRFVSSVILKVRDVLPTDIDVIEPIQVPPVSLQNGEFDVMICWNGQQFSPEVYDPVVAYEIRIYRLADKTLIIQSGQLPAKSPMLQSDYHRKSLNSPEWPLPGTCCCWSVPVGYLKAFSHYEATYKAIARDNVHPNVFSSETNFSRPTIFRTPGSVASVSRINLLSLDSYSATFSFAIKPVMGEYPVAHQLNVTVSKPGHLSQDFACSDKLVVNSSRPELNKTCDDLKPFTRYIVKAYVINPQGHSQSRAISFITLPGELDPIRSLRASTLSTTSISVRFYIPEIDTLHDLSLGSGYRLEYVYAIAYELLLADLSTTTCPNLEELCQNPGNTKTSADTSDCRCILFDSDSRNRYIEERLTIGNLRPNRPYRFSVRYQFKPKQFEPNQLLWPPLVSSPWTNLNSGKSYVFTESIPLKTPPILRNASVNIVADNATTLVVSFYAVVGFELDLARFESVWAVYFRCGNWSRIISLKNPLPRNSVKYSFSGNQNSFHATELLQFEVDASKEPVLFTQPVENNRCRLLVCPLTKSRIKSSDGSLGPCSLENFQFTLPSVNRFSATDYNGSPEMNSFSRSRAMKGALAAVMITIIIIIAILIIILVMYLRRNQQSLLCCCFDRKGQNRRQPSSSIDVHSNASSQALQLLGGRSADRNSSKQKRPPSCLSNNEGSLSGSMFAYKVASATLNDFINEFTAVCSRSSIESRHKQFTTTEAGAQHNLMKNRYTNVLAYDHSRVPLISTNRESPGADYVNANWVTDDSSDDNLVFIACQGPLQWTTGDFWQVVVERNVSKIVMLTDLIETSQESIRKCAPYWPRRVGQSQMFKNFRVILMRQRFRSFWVERVFEVSCSESGAQSRLVTHFQYVDWPDHGVPQHALPMLRFTQRVLSATECFSGPTDGSSKGKQNPIVVHCSAGIGRSGVFMVVANELQRLQNSSQLDPAACLLSMRKCRASLVQTAEQFRFIYLALYEAVQAQMIGDHYKANQGVPTESIRLKAWLKNCSDSMLDWASSRVPLHNSALDDDLPLPGFFFLPGPLHSRQLAISTNSDMAFVGQRLRTWGSHDFSCLHLVVFGSESGQIELVESVKRTFPALGITTISTWPPSNPHRIFSSLVPYLLVNHEGGDQPQSPSEVIATSDWRCPNIVIVPAAQSLTSLSLAAELAVALECIGEVRLSFSVDVDPDSDGSCDLLLFGRITTLSLPPGVVTRSNLHRALSLVAAANVNNVSSSHLVPSSHSSVSSTPSATRQRSQVQTP